MNTTDSAKPLAIYVHVFIRVLLAVRCQQWNYQRCLKSILPQFCVHFQSGEDTRIHQLQQLHQSVQQNVSRAGQVVPPTRYCCYVWLTGNKDSTGDWLIRWHLVWCCCEPRTYFTFKLTSMTRHLWILTWSVSWLTPLSAWGMTLWQYPLLLYSLSLANWIMTCIHIKWDPRLNHVSCCYSVD